MTPLSARATLRRHDHNRKESAMSTKRASLVQKRQAPLRDRYRTVPAEAWITDRAHTVNAYDEDPFHGAVVPANGGDAALRFGIHRAIGGFHDYPNPGD